ncbi:MAG: outer membrane beta-barrel protein [Nitrospirota bacterium]
MKRLLCMLSIVITIFFTSIHVRADETDIKITGFVDVSYSTDDNADTKDFNMDQIEVDIEREISGIASLRTDLNFTGTDPLTRDDIIEQGFVTLTLLRGGDTTLTIGKFNAPIGFELLDAPDMYQFSHALVFKNGLPTNLTGLQVSKGLGDMADISLYIVNGWDVMEDNNDGKTFGGRLGISPDDEIGLGLSYITGPEQDSNDDNNRSVLDIDASVSSIQNLLIGAEFNLGKEEGIGIGGGDANWLGYLVMMHYDLKDWVGFTFRYDYFNDKDGQRTGLGKEVVEQAVTFAPTFTIADGMGALIEYRKDFADTNAFIDADGNPSDDNTVVAVEFTYSF